MAENDKAIWLLVGALLGLGVGISLGFVLFRLLQPKEVPTGITYLYDQQGRLIGIQPTKVG